MNRGARRHRRGRRAGRSEIGRGATLFLRRGFLHGEPAGVRRMAGLFSDDSSSPGGLGPPSRGGHAPVVVLILARGPPAGEGIHLSDEVAGQAHGQRWVGGILRVGVGRAALHDFSGSVGTVSAVGGVNRKYTSTGSIEKERGCFPQIDPYQPAPVGPSCRRMGMGDR